MSEIKFSVRDDQIYVQKGDKEFELNKLDTTDAFGRRYIEVDGEKFTNISDLVKAMKETVSDNPKIPLEKQKTILSKITELNNVKKEGWLEKFVYETFSSSGVKHSDELSMLENTLNTKIASEEKKKIHEQMRANQKAVSSELIKLNDKIKGFTHEKTRDFFQLKYGAKITEIREQTNHAVDSTKREQILKEIADLKNNIDEEIKNDLDGLKKFLEDNKNYADLEELNELQSIVEEMGKDNTKFNSEQLNSCKDKRNGAINAKKRQVEEQSIFYPSSQDVQPVEYYDVDKTHLDELEANEGIYYEITEEEVEPPESQKFSRQEVEAMIKQIDGLTSSANALQASTLKGIKEDFQRALGKGVDELVLNEMSLKNFQELGGLIEIEIKRTNNEYNSHLKDLLNQRLSSFDQDRFYVDFADQLSYHSVDELDTKYPNYLVVRYERGEQGDILSDKLEEFSSDLLKFLQNKDEDHAYELAYLFDRHGNKGPDSQIPAKELFAIGRDESGYDRVDFEQSRDLYISSDGSKNYAKIVDFEAFVTTLFFEYLATTSTDEEWNEILGSIETRNQQWEEKHLTSISWQQFENAIDYWVAQRNQTSDTARYREIQAIIDLLMDLQGQIEDTENGRVRLSAEEIKQYKINLG